MILVENLTKGYAGKILFEGISFHLNKGERAALIGRNGCGKSTLLKIVAGLEEEDAGKLHIPKNYTIGYLEQHIRFSQPTVREEAALALKPEERDTPHRVEAILSGLGFSEEDLDKEPASFSGGYQLRIQLAKTLVKEPDCLLLDEPTNYLDIVSIRWLERFLKNWASEMIVISHDRSFLDAISTHTMGIHRNKLHRLEGKTSAFYDHILQLEETHERTRIKQEKQREHAESFIRRFGSKATKAKQAQSRLKTLQRLPSLEKLAEIDGLCFQFRSAPFPGKFMLRVENACFHYPEMTADLISDLSFDLHPGDRIAVIGKNGRGKSTILSLLSGDLLPRAGNIKRAKDLRIGYFGQTNVNRLDPNLTVEEEIAKANSQLTQGEVRGICGQMMFTQSDAEKKIGVLSGGEKSRVLLGKILADSCHLLLLDEPTNHLDIESIEALMEALESFAGSVVIVSHDEEILSRIPDRFLLCKQNKQHLFLGEYEDFLEKVGWDEEEGSKSKRIDKTRKLDKHKRAVLVQERSRALTPLKKRISGIEKQIEEEELVLNTSQTELEKAIYASSNDRVAALTKIMGETQKKVNELYDTLEGLYRQFDEINSTYDGQLEESGS